MCGILGYHYDIDVAARTRTKKGGGDAQIESARLFRNTRYSEWPRGVGGGYE